ncbi:hypothetical protein [Helicobacter sp. 10-6591]|nr:hypothetical protein [Helicobacter sp. 10-6591]
MSGVRMSVSSYGKMCIIFFKNKNENQDEEYFLGSVVIYKENGRQNIIDG